MDPGAPLLWVVWVGICLAVERGVSSLILVLTTRPNFRMRLYPSYTAPHTWALLWAFFTSMSIALVATTSRGSLAVLFKTLHVITEAAFLVLITLRLGMPTVAAVAAAFVLGVAGLVVTAPCSQTITLAAFSGLAVDSLNFLAHLSLGVRQCDNPVLWSLIAAFGWHAGYLVTFYVVQRWPASVVGSATLATARVLGMVFNLVAIWIVVASSRRAKYGSDIHPGQALTLAEWRDLNAGHARVLWTETQVAVIEDADLSDDDDQATPPRRRESTPLLTSSSTGGLVPLHEPMRTAYVDGARARWWQRMPFPWQGARRLDGARTELHTTCFPSRIVSTGERASARRSSLPARATTVRVRGFAWEDVVRATVAVLVGTVLWAS